MRLPLCNGHEGDHASMKFLEGTWWLDGKLDMDHFTHLYTSSIYIFILIVEPTFQWVIPEATRSAGFDFFQHVLILR